MSVKICRIWQGTTEFTMKPTSEDSGLRRCWRCVTGLLCTGVSKTSRTIIFQGLRNRIPDPLKIHTLRPTEMSWYNNPATERYIPGRTKSTCYYANLKWPSQSLIYMCRFAATDLFGFPRRSASGSHFSSQYNYRSAQCKPGHIRTKALLPGLTRR